MLQNVKDFFIENGDFITDFDLIKKVIFAEQGNETDVGGGILLSYQVDSIVCRHTNDGQSYDVKASATYTFGKHKYTSKPNLYILKSSNIGFNLFKSVSNLVDSICDKNLRSMKGLETIVKTVKSLSPLKFVTAKVIEDILSADTFEEGPVHGYHINNLQFVYATLLKLGHNKLLQDSDVPGAIVALLRDAGITTKCFYENSKYVKRDILDNVGDYTIMLYGDNILAVSNSTGKSEPPSSKILSRYRLAMELQN